MRFVRVVVLLVALATLAGCESGSSIPNLTPVLWSVHVGDSGATILSGNLIVGFGGEIGAQELVAVDLASHAVVWRNEVPQPFVGYRQAAGNGAHIFAFMAGEGLRVYTQGGDLLAVVLPPLEDEASASVFGAGPSLDGERLYVPNYDKLYAYDVSNPTQPRLLWRRVFSHQLWALAVDDERIYVGVAEHGADNLLALDPADGHTFWAASTAYTDLQTSVQAPASITVSGDVVLAAVETSIQAFDRDNGERLYVSELLETCPTGPGIVTALEVGEGKVYAAPTSGTCVYAVDIATGKLAWTHFAGSVPHAGFTFGGKPQYLDGVVYAANGYLWALDARTGKVLSLSTRLDPQGVDTYLQYAAGQILAWGDDLTAYKPIR